MTETAPSTFSSIVEPSLPKPSLKDPTSTNPQINDHLSLSNSLNGQSPGHHSIIDQPPTAKALLNGDSHPLRALCDSLHSQITTFLEEHFTSVRLQAVQAQTRHSLQIIQEALDSHPYIVPFHSSTLRPPQSSKTHLFSPS